MNELEPLCNFEQSKMLKELGFREPTVDYYNLYDNEIHKEGYFTLEDRNDYHLTVSRPTISLAKNWLYDKYKLFITVDKFQADFRPKCLMDDGFHYVQNNEAYFTPNEAESDCLTEVLKKLTSEQQTPGN